MEGYRHEKAALTQAISTGVEGFWVSGMKRSAREGIPASVLLRGYQIGRGLPQAPVIAHHRASYIANEEGSTKSMSDVAVDSRFRRQFFHGTRADLAHGDLIVAGRTSNYGEGNPLSWVYCTGTLDAAIWGAELAAGDGQLRIYLVEPTGPVVDDPNLTDKKFPGNPTLSYRSRDPLRVVGEVMKWEGHSPDQLQHMRGSVGRLRTGGAEIID